MRVDGPPRPVTGEILRTGLIERLAARWDVPVTTVVAGPGFGKSTALAQASRLHATAPRGLEAWVTCEPGDEDARRLAGAICRAFGVGAPAAGPLDTALEALSAGSPVESCLILDDVHEVARGSSGQRLIADLVTRLPAGAHLVLSGRTVPPAPLARLHAAELIRCFGETDLAFGRSELDQIALGADRPAGDVADLGGWPALVRLTLAAPAGVARDFLWEEVLSALTASDRDVLLHLAVLGSADAGTLATLAGVTPDLDLLAERVPLVVRVGDGEVRAHPLWTGALVRLLPAARVAAARSRAADLLLERGDALRAGTIAITAGDVTLLDRAATALVAATLATFPHDTGRRWLDAVPECEHHRPGLRLLTAATRYASRADDVEVDAIVDAAARDAHAGGDVRAETAALSLATIAAHARGDESRLAELYQQAIDLPGAAAEPTLRLLLAGVRGAIFELMGSLDDALATVEALPADDTGRQPGRILVRFHVYLLLLAGRADEAAAVAETGLAAEPYAHVRRMPQFARWMAGDPADFLPGSGAARPPYLPEADANDRYRVNFLAFAAVVAASLGDHAALRHVWPQLTGSGLGDDTRDAAMLTVAAAARAVLLGDEPAARTLIEDFQAGHPLSDPVAAVHLRRFLAYAYVLSPAARRLWDRAELGPSQQRVRAAARLLLAARAGRLTDAGGVTPATVLIAFPLPWSVELAAHAEAAGLPFGRELLQWLADHLGRRAHEALRVLAGDAGPAPNSLAGDRRPALAAGARRLLAAVPATPHGHTRIEVLGPLRVVVDGVPAHPADLRRRRVRELLTTLAVHGELDRGRLMGLLWPDLGPDAAARNLRVTLTYLRRVLGDGHVRADRSRVRLVRSKALTTDLAEWRDHLDEVRRARTRGDPAGADAALESAVRLWRGDPLPDAGGVPDLEAAATALTGELIEAALTLGERRLAQGDTVAAAELARRAWAAEPYAERCMRLFLAVATQRRDPLALERAVSRVHRALESLGTQPEPATAIVLRQALLTRGRATPAKVFI